MTSSSAQANIPSSETVERVPLFTVAVRTVLPSLCFAAGAENSSFWHPANTVAANAIAKMYFFMTPEV
jgi:hypothetical protein